MSWGYKLATNTFHYFGLLNVFFTLFKAVETIGGRPEWYVLNL
uniref:Uncharacterized protein n=1 Tax=mine drainage metagenome TaxID=410659 RepID=E6QRH4_9ZZZZ